MKTIRFARFGGLVKPVTDAKLSNRVVIVGMLAILLFLGCSSTQRASCC